MPLQTLLNRTASSNPQRHKALVVDDERTSLLILKALLEREGFSPVLANSGEMAIELFEQEKPDIIFVDVIMPGMNGLEVVRQIKKMSGQRFIPTLFLTSIHDENTLAACIEAGGDDFLTKPVSPVILRAKITAAERIALLYGTVQRQHHQLLFEQELARQVYAKTLKDNAIRPGEIFTLQRPASLFSGDLLLAEHSPSGALYVLLGDFTGHGLAAAIGALPAADVFRGMSGKGYSPPEILQEMHRKLKGLLPTGMFLAAVFVCLHQDGRTLSIINCGLPDVLVLDGKTSQVKHRIPSSALPLGISVKDNPIKMSLLEVQESDQVIAMSDGFIEATDDQGTAFGDSRLISLLETGDSGGLFERLVAGLDAFTGNSDQDDDVTLAVIPCRKRENLDLGKTGFSLNDDRPINRNDTGTTLDTAKADWQWETVLRSPVLQRMDIAPVLLEAVTEFIEGQRHRHELFTVLSELLNNALDHGLLNLDSRIKDSPEGFVRYFQERSNRLAQLNEGYIRINFYARTEASHGWLLIRVEDSGSGFDYPHWVPPKDHENLYAMRGLCLVKGLCESLHFEGRGNIARAVYTW